MVAEARKRLRGGKAELIRLAPSFVLLTRRTSSHSPAGQQTNNTWSYKIDRFLASRSPRMILREIRITPIFPKHNIGIHKGNITCQVPIGAYAVVSNGEIKLTAICARPDGTKLLREIGTGTDPVELGQRLGAKILARGGDQILQDVYNENAASTTPR